MSGRTGYGIRVFVDGVEIGSLLSLDQDDATRDIIDVTHYTSAPATPGGPVMRAYVGSETVKGPAYTMEVLLDADAPREFGRGAAVPFRVQFPPKGQQVKGAQWASDAVVESIGGALPMNDRMVQRIRVQTSGPITITPGSSTVTEP